MPRTPHLRTKGKKYACASGRFEWSKGVYQNWQDIYPHVTGVPGAIHEKFKTTQEAVQFVQVYGAVDDVAVKPQGIHPLQMADGRRYDLLQKQAKDAPTAGQHTMKPLAEEDTPATKRAKGTTAHGPHSGERPVQDTDVQMPDADTKESSKRRRDEDGGSPSTRTQDIRNDSNHSPPAQVPILPTTKATAVSIDPSNILTEVIILRNLPPYLDDDDLRTMFADVNSIVLISTDGQGNALIRFNSIADAHAF